MQGFNFGAGTNTGTTGNTTTGFVGGFGTNTNTNTNTGGAFQFGKTGTGTGTTTNGFGTTSQNTTGFGQTAQNMTGFGQTAQTNTGFGQTGTAFGQQQTGTGAGIGAFGSQTKPATGTGFGGSFGTTTTGMGSSFGTSMGSFSGMSQQTPQQQQHASVLLQAVASVKDRHRQIHTLPAEVKNDLRRMNEGIMKEHAKFASLKEHFQNVASSGGEKRQMQVLERSLQELVIDTSRLMQSLGTLEARLRDENLYAQEASKNLTVYSLRGTRPSNQVRLPSQHLIRKIKDFQRRLESILEVVKALQTELSTTNESKVTTTSLKEAIAAQQEALMAIATDAARINMVISRLKDNYRAMREVIIRDGQDPFSTKMRPTPIHRSTPLFR